MKHVSTNNQPLEEPGACRLETSVIPSGDGSPVVNGGLQHFDNYHLLNIYLNIFYFY